ncbi:hypothetical protein D3C78_1564480 [compost metagenome]
MRLPGTSSDGKTSTRPVSSYQSMPRSPMVTAPMRQPRALSKSSRPSGVRPSCSHMRSAQTAMSIWRKSSSVFSRTPPPSSDVSTPACRHARA